MVKRTHAFKWINNIIQHLSSLTGGLITAIAFLIIEKRNIETTGIVYRYWLFIILITLTILIIRLSFGLQLNNYGNLIVTIISAGLAALILTPLISAVVGVVTNNMNEHADN